jgi:hypothetical protein
MTTSSSRREQHISTLPSIGASTVGHTPWKDTAEGPKSKRCNSYRTGRATHSYIDVSGIFPTLDS